MRKANCNVVRSLVRSLFISPVVLGLISASAYGQMVTNPDIQSNNGLPYGTSLDIYHGGHPAPSQPYRQSVIVASLSHSADVRSSHVAIFSVESSASSSGSPSIIFSKILAANPPKNFTEPVAGGASRVLRVSEYTGDFMSPEISGPFGWARPNTPYNARVVFYELAEFDWARPLPVGWERYSDVLNRSHISPLPNSDRLRARKVAANEQTFTVGDVPYFKSAPVNATMSARVVFRPKNPSDNQRIAVLASQKLNEFMQGFVDVGNAFAPQAAPKQWGGTWLRNGTHDKSYRVGGHLAVNALSNFGNTFRNGRNSLTVPNTLGSITINWELVSVVPHPPLK